MSLPVKLLHEAIGHTISIELKSGEMSAERTEKRQENRLVRRIPIRDEFIHVLSSVPFFSGSLAQVERGNSDS